MVLRQVLAMHCAILPGDDREGLEAKVNSDGLEECVHVCFWAQAQDRRELPLRLQGL